MLRIIEAGRRQQVGDKSEIKVDTKTRESGMWNEGARGRRKGRAREYSRQAYRYATPSAINISGEEKKKDGRTWAGSKGTVAKVLSLAFTMKRRKGSPSFSSSSSSSSFPLSSSCLRLFPFDSLSLPTFNPLILVYTADCLTCPRRRSSLYTDVQQSLLAPSGLY